MDGFDTQRRTLWFAITPRIEAGGRGAFTQDDDLAGWRLDGAIVKGFEEMQGFFGFFKFFEGLGALHKQNFAAGVEKPFILWLLIALIILALRSIAV